MMKLGDIARRGFLKLLGAAGVVAGCTTRSDDAGSTEGAVSDGETFDYIVVGSGAGGGPLAANLARAGFSVCVLEAGKDPAKRTDYQVPAMHTQSTEDPTMRWDYFVDHFSNPSKNGRGWADTKATADGKIFYPRSGSLGGCTAHNAMILVYPHESDWDAMAEVIGDDSWNAANMRRYFEILQDVQYIEGKRNAEGWLQVNRADKLDPGLTGMNSLGLVDLLAVKKSWGFLRMALAGAASLDTAFGLTSLPDAVKNLYTLLKADANAPGQKRDRTEAVFGIPLAITGKDDPRGAGKRNSTREYLVRTKNAGRMKNGGQLTIVENALVTRILLEDAKKSGAKVRKADTKTVGGDAREVTHVATGVELLEGEYLYEAHDASVRAAANAKATKKTLFARREVIVAAGAFNTPQLLMLSGIGPSKSGGGEWGLEDAGVKPVIDLRAVGTNLQDRYEVGIVTKVAKPFGTTAECKFGAGVAPECNPDKCVPANADQDPCMTEWLDGKGAYLSNGGVIAMAKRSSTAGIVPMRGAIGTSDAQRAAAKVTGGEDPDLFVFGLPGSFPGYSVGYSKKVADDAKDHFTWLCLKGHTRNNAGYVRLKSNNPRETPAINFRSFNDGKMGADAKADLDALVEGVQFMRQIIRKSSELDRLNPLDGSWNVAEVYPGNLASDASAIGEWAKTNAWGHHASCTCPIGPDPETSVLDSAFRVHKTSRLRVVDASVFPRIPGFFIVSAIYMVSEKATDVILEGEGKSRDDMVSLRSL